MTMMSWGGPPWRRINHPAHMTIVGLGGGGFFLVEPLGITEPRRAELRTSLQRRLDARAARAARGGRR